MNNLATVQLSRAEITTFVFFSEQDYTDLSRFLERKGLAIV
jgi:hypothetical protein